MRFILTIIGGMIALDAAWWMVSARLTRRRLWRRVIAVFMTAQMAGLLWMIGGRVAGTGWDRLLPKFATSAIFNWHFFGLALVVALGGAALPFLMIRFGRRLVARTRRAEAPLLASDRGWTRRDFLGMAAAAGPPLFTLSLTGISLAQLNRFRVRHLVVPLPALPRELDGLTIAHVSDMHVGRFTSGRVLREMVAATNGLRADLVLLTGDLINDALADLSAALEIVRGMEGRFGLCLIEGNHDLIEDGAEFERRAKASGLPFLLDESTVLQMRGRSVQLLGLRWTRAAAEQRDPAIGASVRALVAQRHPDAFPILLAHHPHAFDAAADAGLPLTLAGHTHGGQLMLNEAQGFGPALFRYWSGLYARGPSRLVVSNGIGNWFPLRLNAPAEIIHLTLRAV